MLLHSTAIAIAVSFSCHLGILFEMDNQSGTHCSKEIGQGHLLLRSPCPSHSTASLLHKLCLFHLQSLTRRLSITHLFRIFFYSIDQIFIFFLVCFVLLDSSVVINIPLISAILTCFC